MRTLVLYDSLFGNTARIAQAIARGAGALSSVRIMNVAEATEDPPAPPDLLLVGGPTQGHGLSPSLRSCLHALPSWGLRGVLAAAFDTRYRMSKWLSGSAARAAARPLRRAGCLLIASPESFFVEPKHPPAGEKRAARQEGLEAGELERAEGWGRAMGIAALKEQEAAVCD